MIPGRIPLCTILLHLVPFWDQKCNPGSWLWKNKMNETNQSLGIVKPWNDWLVGDLTKNRKLEKMLSESLKDSQALKSVTMPQERRTMYCIPVPPTEALKWWLLGELGYEFWYSSNSPKHFGHICWCGACPRTYEAKWLFHPLPQQDQGCTCQDPTAATSTCQQGCCFLLFLCKVAARKKCPRWLLVLEDPKMRKRIQTDAEHWTRYPMIGAPWLQGSSHSLGSHGLTESHKTCTSVTSDCKAPVWWKWVNLSCSVVRFPLPLHSWRTKSSPSRPQVTTVVTLGTATGAWPPSAADSGPNSLATNESNDTTAPPMAGRPTVGPPPSDQKLQSLLPRALQARTSQLNCTNCRTSASAESHTLLLGLEEVNLPSFQSVQLHLGFLEKVWLGVRLPNGWHGAPTLKTWPATPTFHQVPQTAALCLPESFWRWSWPISDTNMQFSESAILAGATLKVSVDSEDMKLQWTDL